MAAASTINDDALTRLRNRPLALGKALWPGVDLFDKQREIIRSVWRDRETFVRAVNHIGKDFVAGYAVVVFFLTHHPCRILTTSATERHLDVLWGEINARINSSAIPLLWPDGPLLVKQRKITRRIKKSGEWKECDISYVVGKVAGPDSLDAMGGHHAEHTLYVSDESSSVADEYYRRTRPWAKHSLIFGNTWPCDNHFRHAFEGKPGSEDRGGDIVAS